jgi:energy-coupling factor transport system permease protein
MQPIYIAGTSPLHALHPLTKIAGAGLLIVATYTLPWSLAPLAVCGVVLILSIIGGITWRLFRAVLLILLPIAFSLFLIQGILFPPTKTLPLPLGPVTIWLDGLIFGFLISTRLLALAASVLLVIQTTHPADLVFAVTERGLPRSIGFILLVALQLVPDMSARATSIQEAQRSRGLETKGLLRRVSALPPLVGPLIVGALVDVEERAMALESRAYTTGGPKSSLRQLIDTPGQRIARLAMLLALVALIVGRVALAVLA